MPHLMILLLASVSFAGDPAGEQAEERRRLEINLENAKSDVVQAERKLEQAQIALAKAYAEIRRIEKGEDGLSIAEQFMFGENALVTSRDPNLIGGIEGLIGSKTPGTKPKAPVLTHYPDPVLPNGHDVCYPMKCSVSVPGRPVPPLSDESESAGR